MLSKSMVAKFDFNFFLGFVEFKSSKILKPVDEVKGSSGGR